MLCFPRKLTGDYSLRISPVTLEDNAEFQCQVTGGANAEGVRSQSAKLTVYAPPETPHITQGPVSAYIKPFEL